MWLVREHEDGFEADALATGLGRGKHLLIGTSKPQLQPLWRRSPRRAHAHVHARVCESVSLCAFVLAPTSQRLRRSLSENPRSLHCMHVASGARKKITVGLLHHGMMPSQGACK